MSCREADALMRRIHGGYTPTDDELGKLESHGNKCFASSCRAAHYAQIVVARLRQAKSDGVEHLDGWQPGD